MTFRGYAAASSLLTAAAALAWPVSVQARAETTVSVGDSQLLQVAGDIATVFVADPEIADVQVPGPGAVLVLGRKAGTTALYVLDAGGGRLVERRIIVRHNVDELQGILSQRFPALRLTLESAPGSMMVKGSVPDAETAEAIARTVQPYLGEKEQLINRVAVSSPTQVYLQVRVAEVSKAITQKLGVNWSVIATPGRFTTGLINGRAFQSITGSSLSAVADTVTATIAASVAQSLGGALSGTAGAGYNGSSSRSSQSSWGTATSYTADPDGGYSFLGGYSKNGNSFQAMIDVLDREGLVSILAEPNLTAVSGQTASFLAGGEFPVPVKQDKDTMSVEFKPFGVALDFTPTVLSDDRISIKVRPEISEIDPNSSIVMDGLTIPGLSVRRVETTVEMASGQSFAIGGLLQNNVRDVLSKVPGLGSLPILGKLFSSSEYQNNKTELVVIVTPYLVRPTGPDQLTTPLASMRANTDIEYVLQERIGFDPLSGTVPRLTGSAGFVY